MQKIYFENGKGKKLNFSDFALKLLDGFLSFSRLNLQSVKLAGSAKFQLDTGLESFDSTELGVCAHFNEFFRIKDFTWHAFSTY